MSAAVMLFGVRTKERDKREEVILWPGNTHICLLWSVVGWVINSFHPGILCYCQKRIELQKAAVRGPWSFGRTQDKRQRARGSLLARPLVTFYNHHSFKMTEYEIQPPFPLLFLSD